MPAIRAVIDTNVVLAGQRSASRTSPNVEIIRRWKAGAFIWLLSADMASEYVEKLLESGIAEARIDALMADLLLLGETVAIEFFHLRHYPKDPDDTAFLLTALNGSATHLVSYDGDLHAVAVFYPEFITCEPVEFLEQLRGAGT